MGYAQHSFASDQFGLHAAAMAGDDEGVRRALDMGADINALDKAGRTAVMCAVAGKHWQSIDASFLTPKRLSALQLLIKHPDITLFTLNAPHSSMNGVIPLGMAAWLNLPDVVRLLLEDSSHTVSVDGMDSHGATALMYAARDSNLEVVQCLLFHGARPDFRDCNHRTSIQFALAHPQILWLCESTLRRHRWREIQSADRNKLAEELQELATSSLPCDNLVPPPSTIFTEKAISRSTDTLISSITSSDLSFLHSLLFAPTLSPSSPAALYPMSAPILVNRPDSSGWAPIHHCASMEYPSIPILDALYCAGAEVSLFTTHEHYTPLHILAQSSSLPVEYSEHAMLLYHFAVHLIRDLRAPLSAKDKNDETCIHIAAERGNCINLLMIFLDYDTTGCIRELRNSRGLTALEVCRPEFRVAFGDENLRSVSSLSCRTIRPTRSFASLASFTEWRSTELDDDVSLFSPMDFDVEGSTHQLLFNLRATSPNILHGHDAEHLTHLTKLVCESSELNHCILNHFRSRVQEATKELQSLQQKTQKILDLVDLLTLASSNRLRERGFDPWPLEPKPRGSADSENTAVASQGSRSRSSSIAKPAVRNGRHISVATQTLLSSRAVGLDCSTYNFHLASLAEIERQIVEHSATTDREGSMISSYRPDAQLKNLIKKKKQVEDRIREMETNKKAEKKDAVSYGASRLKAWIKRIISPDRLTKVDIVMDIDEEGCTVGRETKGANPPSGSPCEAIELSIDGALHTSHIVLRAAQRDLLSISECLTSAEQFINLSNHSIARAERVVKRAVKKREAMIANICHLASAGNSSDGKLSIRQHSGAHNTPGHSNLLCVQPSIASIASAYSSHSRASIAPTLMENDDEDARAVRRLLLRKIEAGVVGSWSEMEKAMSWMRIVKEVVRGVKRRAYL